MRCATDPVRQRERRSRHAIPSDKLSVEAAEIIHRSSDGEVWYLTPDVKAERFLVSHLLNDGSGGYSPLVDIASFLSEQHAPQYEALEHLLLDLGYLLPVGLFAISSDG
jgi:hypothetical protein